jgi:hypothetical protein
MIQLDILSGRARLDVQGIGRVMSLNGWLTPVRRMLVVLSLVVLALAG